jgi:hypothetical protein
MLEKVLGPRSESEVSLGISCFRGITVELKYIFEVVDSIRVI